MAWNGLTLTVDGRNALNNAQLSNRMSIKSIVVGDGKPPANFSTQKALVHQLYAIKEIRIDKTESGCTVTADFPKVDYDYYFREVGIIIETDQGDKLYVYDNCGDDAQHIVSSTGAESTRKRLRLSLIIADVEEITVSNPSILYVAYDDFEAAIESLEQNIEDADIKQQEALEAVKKLLENAIDNHLIDKENPHNTTKEQIGLGNADDTADIDKPVSRAQQAALDDLYQQLTAYTQAKIAELINGAPTSMDTLKEVSDAIAAHKSVMDALDAAIGKKASAAEFDSHVKDTTAHVTAAERNTWNGKQAAITGAASTVTANNLTANRALVSNGSGKLAVSSVTATELGFLAGLKSNIQTKLNELNSGLAGKANSSHTHTKSQITDFPSSMPASDVYAWAKAASKPSYSWSEITGKPSTYPPSSHTHDDRYYTESEINTKLAGKSDSNHTHNTVPLAEIAGRLGSPILLTIGKQGKTLNAGDNVVLTLKDIGAADAYHEHSNYFAGADSGVISVDRIQPINGAGDATVNACAAALQSRNKSNSAWAPMYASAFTVQSSRRYKDNIVDMDGDTARSLLQYRVVTYDYKNPEDGQNCQGLIAEEVAEINPYPVIFKDGVADGLDYSRFVPQLIKMVQLQQQRITSLEERVAKLEN